MTELGKFEKEYFSDTVYDYPEEYEQYAGKYDLDLDFWMETARRYGDPILELACGTGRITLPLAQAGFQITGLDMSSAMLQMARKKAEQLKVSVEWIQADCCDFSLPSKFSLNFLSF